jgi:hypothetical protein
MSSTLQLYTFSPAWGLPTAGPFGLKLEACLRMLRIPYERRFEKPLVRFVDRALEHWFPDSVAGSALSSKARGKAPSAPHPTAQPV